MPAPNPNANPRAFTPHSPSVNASATALGRITHPIVPHTLPPVTQTLAPIMQVPQLRLPSSLPPISPARPSTNLGHPLNGASGNVPHLFDSINLSSTLPFHGINPRKHNPVSDKVGNPIANAVHALQRPVSGQGKIPGEKPVVPFGQRIKAAIKAVRG